jgi:uncharacterized protein involved in exopolysaccharide biosynthesis
MGQMDEPVCDGSDEINLLDYFRVIWKNKIWIALIVVVVVATTVVVSLLMTPIYQSRAVISPATTKPNDLTGGASAIALQFGIATPASSNMSEIANLLRSNILREKVLIKYNLFPVLFSGKPIKWKSDDEKMWAGIRFLETAVKVNPVQKDNIIQITADFRDPKVARDLVSYVLVELIEHMSSEAKRVAETNKKYLESQLDKTADPFIKTKVYSLIAQQIETSMMAEVKENFAFKIIDPPRAPDKRIKPKRTQMALIAFTVSLFLGIFLAFGKEYVTKARLGKAEPSGGV